MGSTLSGVLDDSNQLELVNTAIEKTREGRLRWRRENGSYEADLPGGGQLVFAISGPHLFGKKTWANFIVRRNDGTEVLAVQHTESPSLEGLLGGVGSELQNSVEQLFSIITGSARVEVEKIIEQIKNL